ncbi:unnamed protein product [Cuscuta epithymum]|uniref:Uncharacterized protein n=1 Tax=Cuscuta epithymum TaxID=186058 RepID=A0AAV0CTN3_9ASTE|nr:unnamed protein product [Cuscuta epithymum]
MTDEQSTSAAQPNFAPMTEAEGNNERAVWVTPAQVAFDKTVFQGIKNIIGGHFLGIWASYSDVDPKVRELLWNLFKARYRWTHANGADILRAYNYRISAWLRPTFKRARNSGRKPKWVSDEVWTNLCRHSSSDPKFLARSQSGKKNRMSEKALETQWHGGRKSQYAHKETLAGPEKKKVNILNLVKHCWTKHGEESEANLPPRLAEFESKYNESVDRRRAERGLTQEDELDSDADDEAAIEAAGVYKGRVPSLGAEGQRILYDRSTGASSSQSRCGEDPRMAQMQRELQEHERRWEEQRKREEETKARMEEMERFMRAGFQPPHQPFPTPYVFHPEQTPQVPHMGGKGLFSNSGHGGMPMISPNFGSMSFDFARSSGGGSGTPSHGARGGPRGGTRPDDPVQQPEDPPVNPDEFLVDDDEDEENPNFFHNGVRR